MRRLVLVCGTGSSGGMDQGIPRSTTIQQGSLRSNEDESSKVHVHQCCSAQCLTLFPDHKNSTVLRLLSFRPPRQLLAVGQLRPSPSHHRLFSTAQELGSESRNRGGQDHPAFCGNLLTTLLVALLLVRPRSGSRRSSTVIRRNRRSGSNGDDGRSISGAKCFSDRHKSTRRRSRCRSGPHGKIAVLDIRAKIGWWECTFVVRRVEARRVGFAGAWGELFPYARQWMYVLAPRRIAAHSVRPTHVHDGPSASPRQVQSARLSNDQ